MTETNPASLDSELQRLPTSLSESVEALENDGVFKDLIGEKLLVAIRGVRKVCLNYTLLWSSGGTLVMNWTQENAVAYFKLLILWKAN